MNYEKLIKNLLDSFGVHRTYTGYNYVVSGLLLLLDKKSHVDHITKSLYVDIASQYDTSWQCVEKNIRTVVHTIWDSYNTVLLDSVFNKSAIDHKPTNKEFFNYMYDYIIDLESPDMPKPMKCPISNDYCESLTLFCQKIWDLKK